MFFRFKPFMLLIIVLAITGISLTVSCGGDGTTPNAEGEQLSNEESQYLELWEEAAAALLDFSMVEIEALIEDGVEEPVLADLVSPYRDIRDAFQSALTNLEDASIPSNFIEWHNTVVPLYQDALGKMDLVIEAAESGDEASFIEAKASFIDTIEKTVEATQ